MERGGYNHAANPRGGARTGPPHQPLEPSYAQALVPPLSVAH